MDSCFSNTKNKSIRKTGVYEKTTTSSCHQTDDLETGVYEKQQVETPTAQAGGGPAPRGRARGAGAVIPLKLTCRPMYKGVYENMLRRRIVKWINKRANNELGTFKG